MTTDATPSRPLPDGYDLCEYLLHAIKANDACPYSHIGSQSVSVKALQFSQSKNPAIHLELSGGGFDVTSQLTPDTARKIAAALFAAAIAVDDFEADECIAQERELDQDREMARYNAGPVEIRNLPGGVTELIAIDETTDLRGWVTVFEGVEVRG